MTSRPAAQSPGGSSHATPLAWALAAVSLGFHLLPRPGYGFHRDELLYLAMGDHLDLFRMQFPPVIALLAQAARALPLDLLAAIHLLSGIAAAAIVLLTARIAARLGGDPAAQALAALATMVSPLVMRAGALFQPVVFELLWWTIAALALVSLLADGSMRWWLVLGAATGVGASTRFTTGVFGAAALVALVASRRRRDLRTPWPWAAALIAALFALPALAGQARWGWPILAQMKVLEQTQLERVSAASFLAGQPYMAGAAAPLLLIGIAAFGILPLRVRFWPAGVYVLAAALLFLATGGKEYYLGPAHPLVIAAGAVTLLVWDGRRRWVSIVTATWLVAVGLATLPVGVPLLRPPRMAAYAEAIGLTRVVTTNGGEVLPLPQDYADMIGWREQVAAVARVFHQLDPAEQARTLIVGGNYGRAGALAVYHREFGLPYPVSRHGDFYNWGFGSADATTLIIVGGSVNELSALFEEVSEAAVVDNPMGVPEEQRVGIHLCRRPRRPLPVLWKELGPVWG